MKVASFCKAVRGAILAIFLILAVSVKDANAAGCEIKRSCKAKEQYCLPIDQFDEGSDERRVLYDFLRYKDQIKRLRTELGSGANRVNYMDTKSSRHFARNNSKRILRSMKMTDRRINKLLNTNPKLFLKLNEQCLTLSESLASKQ